MSAQPASAQSYDGARIEELQDLAAQYPDGFGCPISGDATATDPKNVSRIKLRRIVDQVRAAKDKAGRDQRARKATNIA
ncbi:hypothetical protein [Arthrobacter sp. GMC3]|uniref:hypothetical protein n=1 Tax=Arthrobacter sp. GMC3 TaxID=2058894 RepID=UPI000CE49C10|nr:hypothetical protein [Arthrobacter sp. GMC3]